MLRSEILANRQIVIAFLLQPKRKKAIGKLDKGNGERCCLGHMSYALNIPRKLSVNSYCYGHFQVEGYAPIEAQAKLGLYTSSGTRGDGSNIDKQNFGEYDSLAILNDMTTTTPQQIGKYLESVIEGGLHTPWKPLSEYPETLQSEPNK